MKLLLSAILAAGLSILSPKTNHLENPQGIDPQSKPTFSWILSSTKNDTYQSAYSITVKDHLGRRVWASERIASDNSIAVKYGGPALKENTSYSWSVTVWDNYGRKSTAAGGSFSTALNDFDAAWITTQSAENEPSYFQKEFKAERKIRRATAYLSACGIYEAWINGQRISDAYFTPGWTSYDKYIQYQTYDITRLLKTGAGNMISCAVTPGWWSSGLGWTTPDKRFRYGQDVALKARIIIEYSDGSTAIVDTDESWKAASASENPIAEGIIEAGIYDGQAIDSRLRDASWRTTAQRAWKKAKIDQGKAGMKMVVSESEPVVKHATLKAKELIITPKGEKVIDFGQNISGWEKARLSGPEGTKVVIRHAEVLDSDGNFYTKNLRRAKATSTYTLNGKSEIFEPTHTYYGFRYICIEGIDDIRLDDFTAEVVYSGFENTGSFSCSNPIINQLQSNIEWSFHDNYLEVPTDCPQRDERLGWTGDAQVFFRTASFLSQVNPFFIKWLKTLASDQSEDGCLAKFSPKIAYANDRHEATGWADAGTIIPWQHYMAFGDPQVLENQFESMTRWCDYMIAQSKDNGYIWNTGNHFGDWLYWKKDNDPDGVSAVTSKHLVAQCFFVHSLDITAWAAEVLGREKERKYYSEMASTVRKAYNDEYVSPNGLVSADTQTAYTLALHFDLLPEHLRSQAVERLVKNIERYNYHITTGFLGTPYICEVLTKGGRSDVAYKLLLQEDCPGWLYQVTKGATTIWERWDSIKPDGSIIEGMNSFNHYSFGSIGDWLYRSAVGIEETSPGYKTLSITPHPGGGFTWMQASTKTPYGEVKARWEATDDVLTRLEVTIPAGATADIYVPQRDGSLEHHVKGSGSYVFEVK